jgi:hypothetical protein
LASTDVDFSKQRLAGETAGFLRLPLVLQAVAGQRGVGDDQAIERMRQRLGGDIVHALFGQIRRDLQEYRDFPAGLCGLLIAGGKNGGEQRRRLSRACRSRRPGVFGEEMLAVK